MRLYLGLALLLCCLVADLTARRGGFGGRFGGFGSRSSSSRSGGLFGRRSTSSRSGSSYPRQQWGSSSNSRTGTNSRYNSGSGSSYPKQQWGSSIGGGGFAKPRPGSYGSYGSFGAVGAAAAASKPKYSFKSPGYGTRFGTSFAGGVGRYKSGYGSGLSKKKLGLGVGAGFLGGAALGAVGSVAALNVYHRYMMYRQLLYMHQFGSYNNNYYNNQYLGGSCFGGCPINSYCSFGHCQCLGGFEQRYGRCWRPEDDWRQARISDPFSVACRDTGDCAKMDMNLICNTNKTIGPDGRCECREDMRWNSQEGECQIYLDVDCSAITYDTEPSKVVLEAVNATLEKIEKENSTQSTTTTTESTTSTASTAVASESTTVGSDNTTLAVSTKEAAVNETILEENKKEVEKALENSLLSSIDPKEASEKEIREAFCRDIDTFSWEFAKAEPYRQSAATRTESTAILSAVFSAVAIFLVNRN
eukprot:TRINITY_DN1109_c0_g1_i2.p1 TRINITY_DN1109_c0_g1~~TRINITY_DN1109_c0_g1_i2.p1  ORF type:complete len:474 (-),score=121.22 TRINITY_DN1109_c0_g1_i2:391-1812(-)